MRGPHRPAYCYWCGQWVMVNVSENPRLPTQSAACEDCEEDSRLRGSWLACRRR